VFRNSENLAVFGITAKAVKTAQTSLAGS